MMKVEACCGRKFCQTRKWLRNEIPIMLKVFGSFFFALERNVSSGNRVVDRKNQASWNESLKMTEKYKAEDIF